VYVANTPKTSPDDVVRVALRIQELGLTASPHVIARRVVDAQRLRDRLRVLAAGGVRQVLLVAGDLAIPDPAFSSTLELLESGVVQDAGIRRVGVAGHPEGHPVVPDAVLWEALERKQALARAQGLTMHIATQFGFDTRALDNFEAGLAASRDYLAHPRRRCRPHAIHQAAQVRWPIAGSGLPSRQWREMQCLSGAYPTW
jgi:methylenetetrahydrofolate reductase (NADPH)